jgi:hypothetical protein
VTADPQTMTQATRRPGVIHRDAVRLVGQPALVDCGSGGGEHAARSLAVVPLLDGDRIAGFEIRCGCGAAAVVECVYAEEAP